MTTADIDALKAELATLSKWLEANALEKAGTAEYGKKNAAHRLLTDLVARDGGTPEDRAYVMRKLNE